MTNFKFLSEKFEGKYGDCVDSDRNVNAARNQKQLEYYDSKIQQSQKKFEFAKSGHYIFEYIPVIYSPKHRFNFKNENQEGSCELVITDVFSQKSMRYDLSLDTMVINTHYLHGVLKQGNKRFGGVALLIDDCLHSYQKLNDLADVFIPDTPFVDSELDYIKAKSKLNESFFGGHNFDSLSESLKEKSQQINEKNRYVYGVFKVDEHWVVNFGDGHLTEMHTSKYVFIQALSPIWLKENGLPDNTPILIKSGFSQKDGSPSVYGMSGQSVISLDDATLLCYVDFESECYFMSAKGSHGGGRRYNFNEYPNWDKSKLIPSVIVSGYPLFSLNFSN